MLTLQLAADELLARLVETGAKVYPIEHTDPIQETDFCKGGLLNLYNREIGYTNHHATTYLVIQFYYSGDRAQLLRELESYKPLLEAQTLTGVTTGLLSVTWLGRDPHKLNLFRADAMLPMTYYT